MTTEEIQACRDGYIYVHDMSARRDTMNCCLFDMPTVLKGGFRMGNLDYSEPKTLDVAFDLIADISMNAAACQYGGFSLSEIDKLLAPYAEKSYSSYESEYQEDAKELLETLHISFMEKLMQPLIAKLADKKAMKKVKRDMEQGFQGWEMKFNSVASSRHCFCKDHLHHALRRIC